MDSMSSLLIEFIGIPGAGKSTISKRAVHLMSKDDVCVKQPTYDINNGLSSLVRPFAKIPYVVYESMGIKNTALSTYIKQKGIYHLNFKLLFNWLFVNGVIGWEVGKKQITVLDQGLLQALWSFHLSEPEHTTELFRSVLLSDKFPKSPTLIVCVNVKSKIAKTRLSKREKNPSPVGSDESTPYNPTDAIESYRHIKENVIPSIIKKREDTAVLSLNNNDRSDFDENVKKIYNFAKNKN
jgi:thymidylate kinase